MNIISIAVLIVVVLCITIALKKKRKGKNLTENTKVDSLYSPALAIEKNNIFSDFLLENPNCQSDGMILLGADKCYSKRQFLTDNERKMFNAIKASLPEKLTLLTQVRLVDFINPNDKFPYKSKEFFSLFKEISHFHSDFVLMDSDFSIVACIELEDERETLEKKKKDLVMDEVFKQAEVKLFRFKSVSDTMTNDDFNELLEFYQ